MTQKKLHTSDSSVPMFPDMDLPSPSPKKCTRKRSSKTKKSSIKTLPIEPEMAYQPVFAQRLLTFFDIPPFRITEVQKKDGSISLLETASELPTFAAFARSLGTTQAQLMRWEEIYPDFAQAAKKARDLQGDILIQNSLRGNYSASFAMLTAKNLLGWNDNKENTPTTPQTIVVRWEK